MSSRIECERCGRVRIVSVAFRCNCDGVKASQDIHASGPGTELLAIMTELGIKEKPNCTCRATAKKMDQLGVEGCEQNRDWIVSQLEANAAKWSWLETLKIAASNVTNPLALSLAFRGNIYHALLDEAIARKKREQNEFRE